MDDKILSGLREKDNSAFRVLYDYYFPMIENYVVSNSGTREDAEDVFQETVLVLLQKVPAENFLLTASIRTYIYAVASNIWLKKLRDTRRNVGLHSEFNLADLTPSEWELREDENRKQNLLSYILGRVTRHCVIFLTKTFLKGVTREKLMEEMGYKNHHTFHSQKYKCLEQARRISETSG